MNNRTSASRIAEFLGSPLLGNDFPVTGVSSIANPKSNTVCFAAMPPPWERGPAEALVLTTAEFAPPAGTAAIIIVDNPRDAYARVVEYFFDRKRQGISPHAVIGTNVKLGEGIFIGDGVIIEDDVVIGDGTSIDHGAVIKWGTSIGKRCRIGAGTIIGHDGLGSFADEDDLLRNVRHQGQVMIENDVEVGPLCTIARGTIDQTVIGANTHIGPQVNIGHNTIIGKHCIIAGRAHISGSVLIGSKCALWANSVLKDGIRIGDGAVVGMGALVGRNVAPGMTVAALPAIGLKALARFVYAMKWGK